MSGITVKARDEFHHSTLWIAEKWSEEACDFARDKLERAGIAVVPAHLKSVALEQGLLDRLMRRPEKFIQVPTLIPIEHGIPSAVLRSLVGEPEETVEIQGNLLLNEGIQRLQDLSMIATVLTNQTAANAWGNTNAFLGVGDSTTAEAATQTELQAATNRFYKVMNATFPSRSGQTISFQADFTSTEANYVWNEWTVSAGATTASGAGFTTGTTNLNRKVASLGTKSTGTWTLTGQVTLS